MATMLPQERHQINVTVSAVVHEKMGVLAKAAGVPLNTYAKMLLEAAYAARSAPTGVFALVEAHIFAGADDLDGVAESPHGVAPLGIVDLQPAEGEQGGSVDLAGLVDLEGVLHQGADLRPHVRGPARDALVDQVLGDLQFVAEGKLILDLHHDFQAAVE